MIGILIPSFRSTTYNLSGDPFLDFTVGAETALQGIAGLFMVISFRVKELFQTERAPDLVEGSCLVSCDRVFLFLRHNAKHEPSTDGRKALDRGELDAIH